MFYDYKLSKVIEKITVDEIGEDVKTYIEGNVFKGDIQPTTGQFKRSMGWGDDVVGELILYSDERLDIGDKVSYEGCYEVEKKVPWDYFIYSLKSVKINVKRVF